MIRRRISNTVEWMGAIDWERRVFDSLIPLPDGTSYNCYLVTGTTRTALLDTVDPSKIPVLMKQLETVAHLDYVVAHHAEQDHSGAIPAVLAKYPEAKLVCTDKCKTILQGFFPIDDERFLLVKEGDSLDLGGLTLRFYYMPWVHWPETMVSHLEEERILFSGDLFGSHVATSSLYAVDKPRVHEAAKRYFAEIMMPFSGVIAKHLVKLQALPIDRIAPVHGPMYDDPGFILSAYREWTGGALRNRVVIPYISMHGSTKEMVDHFIEELAKREIEAEPFELTAPDVGKLAMALVDAQTVVIATPTVLSGAHPNVVYAAYLANLLKPRVRYVSLIGSYSWGGKMVEQITGMLTNLKAEVLPPVLSKGKPDAAERAALAELAETIRLKHRAAETNRE